MANIHIYFVCLSLFPLFLLILQSSSPCKKLKISVPVQLANSSSVLRSQLTLTSMLEDHKCLCVSNAYNFLKYFHVMCAKWDGTRQTRVKEKKSFSSFSGTKWPEWDDRQASIVRRLRFEHWRVVCVALKSEKRHKSREFLLLSSSLSSLPHGTLFFCLLILKTPCIMTLRVGICFSFHQKKQQHSGMMMTVALCMLRHAHFNPFNKGFSTQVNFPLAEAWFKYD